MFAGRIVELASTDRLFEEPLASILLVDTTRGEALIPIPGLPPNLAQLPAGWSAIDDQRVDYPVRSRVGIWRKTEQLHAVADVSCAICDDRCR